MAFQQIQYRRDTAARWASNNPILLSGEPGYESDTGRQKIGDGTRRWSSLPYVAERGPAGPQGKAGVAGPQGDDGARGERGPQGPIGASGPATVLSIGSVSSGPNTSVTISGDAPAQKLNFVLPAGPKGDAGSVGPAGPAGPRGPQGETAGVVIKGKVTQWPPSADPDVGDIYIVPNPRPAFVPSVFAAGDAALWDGDSWENAGPIQGPKGDRGDVGPAGRDGADGAAGLTGAMGPAGPGNVLTIGSVTTAAQGSPAIATITGSSPAQTLSFVLPAPQANSLSIGVVEEAAVAEAWITGSPPNQLLNLRLPSASVKHSTSFNINPVNQSVSEGGSATFTASAMSTEWPIVYSWQSSADGSVWTDLPGSGSESLSVPGDMASNGALFRCSAATPSLGRVYSAIARLEVIPFSIGDTSWQVVYPAESDDYALSSYQYRLGADPVPEARTGYYHTPQINGRLFTARASSVDGLTWKPHVGVPPGFRPTNAIHYFNNRYMMWWVGYPWFDPVGNTMDPSKKPRWVSSDGTNWEDVSGATSWSTVEYPLLKPDGLTLSRLNAVTNRYEETRDGINSAVVSAQTSLGSFWVYEESIDGHVCAGKIGIPAASKIGSNKTINDTVYAFCKGVLDGKTVYVASSNTAFYVSDDPSQPNTYEPLAIPRPPGVNIWGLAYGKGTWLATHRTDKLSYYKSTDLRTWTNHRFTDLANYLYWEEVGRPMFHNGRFVLPFCDGDGFIRFFGVA